MPIALSAFGKVLHKAANKELLTTAQLVRGKFKELESILKMHFEGTVDQLFSSNVFSDHTKAELVRQASQIIEEYYDFLARYGNELEIKAFSDSQDIMVKLFLKHLKADVVTKEGRVLREAVVLEDEQKNPVQFVFGTGDLNEDFKWFVKDRLQKGIDSPGVYIKSIAPDHIKVVQRAMLSALEKGADLSQGRDVVLRQLKGAVDFQAIRDEMEYKVMRVMRTTYAQSANSVTYKFGEDNKELITGFQRVADGRPCFICVMLDGKFYEHDEPHDDHPNGMCRWVPVIKSPSELGFTMRAGAEEKLKKALDIPKMEMTDAMAKQLLPPTVYNAMKQAGLEFEQMLMKKNGNWSVRGLKDISQNAPKVNIPVVPKIVEPIKPAVPKVVKSVEVPKAVEPKVVKPVKSISKTPELSPDYKTPSKKLKEAVSEVDFKKQGKEFIGADQLGVNYTKFYELPNGSKYVVKMAPAEETMGEVIATDFADLFGISDKCVVSTAIDKRTVVQKFESGYTVAGDALYGRTLEEAGKLNSALRDYFTNDDSLSDMFSFDFILGNEDRHRGNFLLKMKKSATGEPVITELKMIDNGRIFYSSFHGKAFAEVKKDLMEEVGVGVFPTARESVLGNLFDVKLRQDSSFAFDIHAGTKAKLNSFLKKFGWDEGIVKGSAEYEKMWESIEVGVTEWFSKYSIPSWRAGQIGSQLVAVRARMLVENGYKLKQKWFNWW